LTKTFGGNADLPQYAGWIRADKPGARPAAAQRRGTQRERQTA
jgi:hypothetical protein